MNAKHLTLRDFIRQPWKNGGGYTTELAKHDEGSRWLWRLSVAEIERSGPFSEFNGYERTIMLLEGDGIELVSDRGPGQLIVRPGVPLAFDGERKTHCRLVDGPVRVLNVIADRERVRAFAEAVPLDAPVQRPIHTPWMLVYSLRGRVVVECGQTEHVVGRGELSRIDGGVGSLVTMRPLESGSAVAAIAFKVSEDRNRCA